MMRGSDQPIRRILGSKAGLYKVSYIPLREDGSLDDPSLYPAAEWVPKSTVPQHVIQKWREFRLSRSQDGTVRRAYLGNQRSTSFTSNDSSRNDAWSDLSYNDLSSLHDITAPAPNTSKQSAHAPIAPAALERSTHGPSDPVSREIESTDREAIASSRPDNEVSALNQPTPQQPIPANTTVVEHVPEETTTSNTTRAEPITMVPTSTEPPAMSTPAEPGPEQRLPGEHSFPEYPLEERSAEKDRPEERPAEEDQPEGRPTEEFPEERSTEEWSDERSDEEYVPEEYLPEASSDEEYVSVENLPEHRSDEECVSEEYLPEERAHVEYSTEDPSPAEPIPVQFNGVEHNPEESAPVIRSPVERSSTEVSPAVLASIDPTTEDPIPVERALAEPTDARHPLVQSTPVQPTSLEPAHQETVPMRPRLENSEPASAHHTPTLASNSNSDAAPVHDAHPTPYFDAQPSRSSSVQQAPASFAHMQHTHVQPASVQPSSVDLASTEPAATNPAPADVSPADVTPAQSTAAHVDTAQSVLDTDISGSFTATTTTVKSDPKPPVRKYSHDITFSEPSSGESRIVVDTEDHGRRRTAPDDRSSQELFEDPMTDEVPIETLVQERDRALRDVQSSMEQLALLKNLYDTASDSAVEFSSQLREAETEIARLKQALENGLASQRAFVFQLGRTKDEEIAALTQQNRLLVLQATATDAAVRHKAALWEAHLERESEKERERQKRVNESEQERRNYYYRVPVQGLPQHKGPRDEPMTLGDELAELAAEANEAIAYQSERPRKTRRLNDQ